VRNVKREIGFNALPYRDGFTRTTTVGIIHARTRVWMNNYFSSDDGRVYAFYPPDRLHFRTSTAAVAAKL
jgi:hypothetical protein